MPHQFAGKARKYCKIVRLFSQSMQAPLTLKVKPMLISTYTFDTNIRWNKIAIYSVRFDVKSTWFDSLLRHFALFHSTAYPRWWVAFPDGECLNYDVPETTLKIMTILRKDCVYRLFTNETSRYDTNPGHRYFCLSCQQLTANQYEFTAHNVDCSRSLSVCQLLESHNNAYLICILLLCPLINMFACIADENASFISRSVVLFTRLVNAALTRYFT